MVRLETTVLSASLLLLLLLLLILLLLLLLLLLLILLLLLLLLLLILLFVIIIMIINRSYHCFKQKRIVSFYCSKLVVFDLNSLHQSGAIIATLVLKLSTSGQVKNSPLCDPAGSSPWWPVGQGALRVGHCSYRRLCVVPSWHVIQGLVARLLLASDFGGKSTLGVQAGVTGERVRGASGSGRTTPAGGSGPDRRQQSERTYAAVYPRARRSGWRYGSVSRKSRKMCYRI